MQTVVNAFWFTLAIIFLTVTTVTIFAAIISAPLEKLAEFTRAENNASTRKKLANINVWYKEAERLKEAFSQHLQIMARRVNALSDETMTDPLTGLYNRKGFSTLLKQSSHRAERCVIAIDIDHFKKLTICTAMTAGMRCWSRSARSCATSAPTGRLPAGLAARSLSYSSRTPA